MTDPYGTYIGAHYSEDLTSGFLVEIRSKFIPKNGPQVEVESVSFWYGPNHGWGTTSGDLDYSVRVWNSKTKVELAMKRVGMKGRPGVRVVDLKTARLDRARYRLEVAERAFALKEAELADRRRELEALEA